MKKTLAAVTLALSASASAHGITEHIAKPVNWATILILANDKCQTSMRSPVGHHLHNAVAWVDGKTYMGCWYKSPNGYAYEIKMPRIMNEWVGKPRAGFVTKQIKNRMLK